MLAFTFDGPINFSVADSKDGEGRPGKVLVVQNFGLPVEGAPPTSQFTVNLPLHAARQIGAALQAPAGVTIPAGPQLIVPDRKGGDGHGGAA
jgi:hypothetical protein